MTPQEALQLLDNICARLQLSREDHDRIKTAVGILHATINGQVEKYAVPE